jgi:type VII secretion protein EccB
MASRRDQLQSYQFMTQRVISAFVMRETDPLQSPLRRGVGAVFGGLMIAVLVGAVFGVYGILTKVGTDPWQTNGSVVIEKDTGASFVYFDGTLHPTLNYASAMLAAGQPNPAVYRVAGSSLDAVPRGVTVGIPGAPASLPGAANRVGLPWSVCASAGTGSAGQPVTTVTTAVSVAPTGGQTLTDGQGVLMKDSAGGIHLLWHGHRYDFRDSDAVLALFGTAGPVAGTGTWLNTLPAGTDIAMINIDAHGSPSIVVPGRSIGDILTAQTGSGPQRYVVLADGVAPITELQKDLLTARYANQPQDVSLSEITPLPRSGALAPAAADVAAPASPPTLVQPDDTQALCAVTTTAAGSPPRLVVGGTVAGTDTAAPTTQGQAPLLADRVVVPAGHVATVRALAAPNAKSGPYYVVTDLGIKFPVPDASVFAMLGYSPTGAVDVPATVIATIPTGPSLDPVAATRPATVNSVDPVN